MLWRCVMSHGRRLTTASSRKHQTIHMISPPLKPYNQQLLLVFRSLSTVTPPNHEEDRPASGSFYEWMKSIYDEFIRMKKEYEDMKHVNKDERIREGFLKYHITGFRDNKSMTVEIKNNRQLVVSGRTYNSDGTGIPVVIERHVTIPNNDYAQAEKRATFHPNAGCLVVEISRFNKPQYIKIEFE